MSIKENREKERIQKEKIEKQNEMNELLKDVKEKNITQTAKQLKKGERHLVQDEDGNVYGLTGGKYLQELRFIQGQPVIVVGRNKEELDQDYINACKCFKEHSNCMFKMTRDAIIANELNEADIVPDEEFSINGRTYFIIYSERIIMDTNGKTIVSLDDIEDDLSNKTIKNLLMERFKNKR